MNEAANDSAWVSGQDCKKLPALQTNQIAGFGGFCPLASLEKTSYHISSHFGLTGETLILGLRRKGIILQVLM